VPVALQDVLTHGHPDNRLDELSPWNLPPLAAAA
jgi:hypothetical protein